MKAKIRAMSEKEVTLLYKKLYKHIGKSVNGGKEFGMDFPTMAFYFPQITDVMRLILKLDKEKRKEARNEY